MTSRKPSGGEEAATTAEATAPPRPNAEEIAIEAIEALRRSLNDHRRVTTEISECQDLADAVHTEYEAFRSARRFRDLTECSRAHVVEREFQRRQALEVVAELQLKREALESKLIDLCVRAAWAVTRALSKIEQLHVTRLVSKNIGEYPDEASATEAAKVATVVVQARKSRETFESQLGGYGNFGRYSPESATKLAVVILEKFKAAKAELAELQRASE